MQAAVVSKPEPLVRELFRNPALVTCACANVLICYSGRTPVKSYLEGSLQAIHLYAKDYPQGLGMMVLIAEDEPPPDDEGRRAIIATREALKHCVQGSVLVVEGEGFAASAKRSVVAMFSLASSRPFPEKVAGNIQEGAAKLAKLLGPRVDPSLDAALIAAAATSVRKTFP
ncbi:MAG TPA: hypothetical protein VMF89_20210 [Polyangiales bacterium]|nr:hypothetical protein [Polyangiales bacterium]